MASLFFMYMWLLTVLQLAIEDDPDYRSRTLSSGLEQNATAIV